MWTGARPGFHSRSRCWCRTRLRAVPPASAGNTIVVDCSAPDNHFSACPDSGMRASVIRCVDSSSKHPSIRAGIVSAAVVQIAERDPAPDDHFVAGPHCCMRISDLRSIRGAGRCPTVRAWVVPTTGVESVAKRVASAPDNHFSAAPHARVIGSGNRSIRDVGGCPTV
jgi:hypothetical protein